VYSSGSSSDPKGAGMKVVDLVQRSPQWHQWRKSGVTASDACVLMGSPYKTPFRLWAEKKGLVLEPDLSGNPHVQRGIREEPIARRAYEQRHGDLLLPVCAESSEVPILRASFDGLTNDGRPIEIKAPAQKGFTDALKLGTQSCLYLRYYVQVQTQIYVAEADGGVLSLSCDGDYLDLPVPRDEIAIKSIVEQAKAFWECVVTGKEPPLDIERDAFVPKGSEASLWNRLTEEYRRLESRKASLSRDIKALDDPIAKVEADLLDLIGDFCIADADGLRVTRFLQQGGIDYKTALKTLCPDVSEEVLSAYRRNPTERIRWTLKNPESQSASTRPPLAEVAFSSSWF